MQFNEESKYYGLQFVALSEDLVLYCDNWLNLVWTFEPFESNDTHYYVKKVNFQHHYLTMKKVDYFNSGKYYCHGLITRFEDEYLVHHYSIIVHGKKYTSSICLT